MLEFVYLVQGKGGNGIPCVFSDVGDAIEYAEREWRRSQVHETDRRRIWSVYQEEEIVATITKLRVDKEKM